MERLGEVRSCQPRERLPRFAPHPIIASVAGGNKADETGEQMLLQDHMNLESHEQRSRKRPIDVPNQNGQIVATLSNSSGRIA